MVTSPSNFSFIDDFIAGSAKPYEKENLEFYLTQDIQNVVTLTSEGLLAMEYMENSKFNHLHIPLNSVPENKKQVNEFIDFLEKAKKRNEKVVVHCQYGQERTGIFLVIYLVVMKKMNVRSAIKLVKQKRPISLQSSSSLRFLLSNYQ